MGFLRAYVIVDEQTREREFGNLLRIEDNFEKFVVTAEDFSQEIDRGIKYMNIRHFLLAPYKV